VLNIKGLRCEAPAINYLQFFLNPRRNHMITNITTQEYHFFFLLGSAHAPSNLCHCPVTTTDNLDHHFRHSKAMTTNLIRWLLSLVNGITNWSFVCLNRYFVVLHLCGWGGLAHHCIYEIFMPLSSDYHKQNLEPRFTDIQKQ